MKDMPLSEEQLDRLHRYDTPTVCNVIELFCLRPRNSGYMDGRIQARFPELPPMVGYAATATFRSAAPADGDAYVALDRHVEAFSQVPSPPIMVFQDLDDPCAAATFGEVMCSAYKAFGAAGLVTSGAGRDLDQVRSLGFPVFSNGVICAHGYSHFPSIQVVVRVGGVTVHPGDLLHGDCNGVTTIPLDIAADVADACEEFVQAEAVVLDYVKGGNVTVQGLSQARSETLRMIEKLRERVTSKQAKPHP